MKMASIHIFVLSFMLLTSLFLTGSFATGGDYGSKEHVTEKPKLEEEQLVSNNIAIQGLVYCKSGSKIIPLEGALTRITCEAADEYGFETTPLSFLSEATDAKGYFLATLCPLDVVDQKQVLKVCRAFLEASPWNNCSDPSDVNKGISGAVLHSYRFLHDKNLNLYTVGPFLFTSSP